MAGNAKMNVIYSKLVTVSMQFSVLPPDVTISPCMVHHSLTWVAPVQHFY